MEFKVCFHLIELFRRRPYRRWGGGRGWALLILQGADWLQPGRDWLVLKLDQVSPLSCCHLDPFFGGVVSIRF